MKNILGIIASPRRLGNCEIIVKEISKNIAESHTLSLLRLSDFTVRPCKGCYLCLFKKRQCIQRDDLMVILNAMADADAMIVAVPTYFLGGNGSLKMLLDRGLAFYAFLERLWGKPSVGVGIAGIKGKEGSTVLDIERFLKLSMSDMKRTAMIYGALPGEILQKETTEKIAKELANALFTSRRSPEALHCPLCGSSSFRFLTHERVRCLLCSNSGTLQMKDQRPVIGIEKEGNGLFLSKEDALEHEDWLRTRVGEYSAKREQMNTLRSPYREGWNWIKP